LIERVPSGVPAAKLRLPVYRHPLGGNALIFSHSCGRKCKRVPVAVPYIFCGGESRLENIDRCHSLASFLPPPAAVGSLPLPAYRRPEG